MKRPSVHRNDNKNLLLFVILGEQLIFRLFFVLGTFELGEGRERLECRFVSGFLGGSGRPCGVDSQSANSNSTDFLLGVHYRMVNLNLNSDLPANLRIPAGRLV